MTCFVEVDAQGRIVSRGDCDLSEATPLTAGAVRRVMLERQPPAFDTERWDGEALVPLPPRPTPHHVFNYDTLAWELDAAAAWAVVRSQRDERIAASDWVVLRAADTGQPVPPEWLAYRQALRDITQQADPLDIEWPVAPSA